MQTAPERRAPGLGRKQAGGRVGPGVSTGMAHVRQGEQAQDGPRECSGGLGRGLPLAAGCPAWGTPRAAPGHTQGRGQGATLQASSWPGKLFAVSRNWPALGGPVSPGSARPQTANSRVPSPAPESTHLYLLLSPPSVPGHVVPAPQAGTISTFLGKRPKDPRRLGQSRRSRSSVVMVTPAPGPRCSLPGRAAVPTREPKPP